MNAKKLSQPKPTTTPAAATDTPIRSAPSRDQVAALAHAIWIDRGRPEGLDLDHWLEAERQLRGEIRIPAAADEISADDAALDPDRAVTTKIEREIGEIASPPSQRSATSL